MAGIELLLSKNILMSSSASKICQLFKETEEVEMFFSSNHSLRQLSVVPIQAISFIVTGKWLTDTESGFRAFKANKLYQLNLDSIGYEIESELLLKALHNNFIINEVPITVPIAVPGVTVIDGFKMGIYKISMGFRLKFGMLKKGEINE